MTLYKGITFIGVTATLAIPFAKAFGNTFLTILAAPLQSEFRRIPLADLNRPRFTLFPR